MTCSSIWFIQICLWMYWWLDLYFIWHFQNDNYSISDIYHQNRIFKCGCSPCAGLKKGGVATNKTCLMGSWVDFNDGDVVNHQRHILLSCTISFQMLLVKVRDDIVDIAPNSGRSDTLTAHSMMDTVVPKWQRQHWW